MRPPAIAPPAPPEAAEPERLVAPPSAARSAPAGDPLSRLAVAVAGMDARNADLAALLDATTELVCATGVDGRITYVNRAWQDALGYTLAEAAARRPVDYVAPEHRARYLETARRLVGGEPVESFEAVLLANDGRRVVCRGHAVPVMADAPGEPRGRRCVATRSFYRDVTPEYEAASRKARLVAMLEATSDLVGTVRPDGGIEYLNAAGRSLLGLADDADLAGLDARHFHLPAAPDQADALAAAVRDGRWEGEGTLRDAAGAEIPVSVVIVAHPSLVPGAPPSFSAVMRDLRERRRAEAAVHASEARFRALFDSAALGVTVVDDDGTVVQSNAAFAAFLGYTPEELAGSFAPDLSPAEDAAVTRAPVAELRAGRVPSVTVEKRFVHRSGELRWGALTLSRVPLGDGRSGLVGLVADVTEQKRAAAALEHERAFLAAVLDSLSDGVVACDAEGKLTLFNRASRHFHGMSEEPLPPEQWSGRYDLYRADGATPLPTDEIPLLRAFRGETVQDAGIVIAPAGGATHTLLASGQQILSASGERLGAVVAMRDVTERARMEAALRESEARYRLLVEQVTDYAIIRLDADGRVETWNAGAERLTGYTAAAIVGREVGLFYPPESGGAAHARQVLAAAARDGRAAEEGWRVRDDGRRFWAHALLTALHDDAGRVVGFAQVTRDLTEQHALQTRLAALSEHDELTELLNRRGFRRMAEHAMKSAVRTHRHDAVLYMDLDRLKPINDTYGHAAGDEALRAAAEVLRTTVRDADIAARLGGDEFAIYAVGLRAGEGEIVATRLRANFEAQNVAATAAGRPFRVECSVGVAEFQAGNDLDALLARADAALYACKVARRVDRGGSALGSS